MTNPTHRLKQFVKYEGGQPPAYCYIADHSGWLGSGVKDKNGVEIFEGDRVKLGGQIFVAEFTNGHFGLANDERDWHDIDLCTGGEVIGHIAEESA